MSDSYDWLDVTSYYVFIGKTGERPSCAQHERKRFIFGFETQGGKLMLKSLKKEEI